MYSVLVLELVILVLEANHQYSYLKILMASTRYSKVEYSTPSLPITLLHDEGLSDSYAFLTKELRLLLRNVLDFHIYSWKRIAIVATRAGAKGGSRGAAPPNQLAYSFENCGFCV